jgi:hypothetical protein
MRSVALRTYLVGVWVLLVAIVVQFLLAGLGIFADGSFIGIHATFGAAVVALLALLLTIAGGIGGVPRRTVWLTLAVFGLVILQSLLLFPYHLGAQGVLRAISGLHVLNALLIFFVCLQLLMRTEALRELGPAPESPAA